MKNSELDKALERLEETLEIAVDLYGDILNPTLPPPKNGGEFARRISVLCTAAIAGAVSDEIRLGVPFSRVGELIAETLPTYVRSVMHALDTNGTHNTVADSVKYMADALEISLAEFMAEKE